MITYLLILLAIFVIFGRDAATAFIGLTIAVAMFVFSAAMMMSQ